MKKSCSVGLFTWAAFAGVYWYFVHDRFRAPYEWIVPLVAGFLTWIAVANLRTGAAAARDAMRVSRHATFSGVTGERPADGDVVTVVGRLRVTGPQLRAPFSGKPAVLYSYEIEHASTIPLAA